METAAAAAGVVPEGEKDAADVTMAAAEEGKTSSEDGKPTRLSQEYVDDILAWKPEPIQDPDEYYNRMINDPLKCFSQVYIEKSTESLRVLAEISERTNARFTEFQAWARAEYEEQGYVEVDDDCIAKRVLLSLTVEDEDFDADVFDGSSAMKDGPGVSIESKL